MIVKQAPSCRCPAFTGKNHQMFIYSAKRDQRLLFTHLKQDTSITVCITYEAVESTQTCEHSRTRAQGLSNIS